MCLPCEQASLMSELKRWCLSQLQNLEVRLTGESSSTKLHASSSAAGGLDEDEGAVLHSQGAQQGRGEPSEAGAGAANHCSVERFPGNLMHDTRFNPFLSWERPASLKRLQLFSAACWLH